MWSATHRWTAIGLWALFIVLAASISMFVAPRQATDLDLGVGESGRAAQTAADAGHPDPVVENALVTARSGKLDRHEADAAANALVKRLGALDEVASVADPVTSKDGTAVLVQATMSVDEADADARVPALQSAVASVQTDHPDLRVEEVGTASIDAQFQDWLGSQLGRATLLSVPLTLVILLVVFGAIVMAGIPVVLGLSSVAAGLGLWAAASQLLPDPGTVTDLLVLVGMAVGVDYSLFYLRRFREERKRLGVDRAATVDAISIAAKTAGHSVVVSGLAVTLSMAGLYFAGNATFSAMATGSILVVLVALVSSVTVLPAMLALFGHWADRPRVPVLWRLTGGRPRLVPALLRRVLARPVAATLAAVVGLLALAAPVLGISLANGDVDEFPRTLTTMQTYDRLVAEFPQGAAPDTVVVQVPAGQEAELRTQVKALDAEVARHPDVFAGTEKPWYSPDGRTAVLTVDVATAAPSSGTSTGGTASASDIANDSVTTLRDTVVPATVGSIHGATADVGGDAASSLDFTANLRHATPIVAAAVLGLTFLVMLVAFRSVAVAGLTVVLNVLSMAASFGVLTLVFQGTWAEGLLGFTSSGHVVSWVPMLLFVVLSGLSLDYHVFVVSRIRENARLGMPTREAILDGVSRTAGTITSAAAVMVGVFCLFGVLGFIELKQFGVGLVVGVVLDATVVRLVLLPATMMLARRRLWWPGLRGARAVVGQGAPSSGAQIGEHRDHPTRHRRRRRKVQLREDRVDVLRHGLLRDDQPLRDARVALALGHEREHLELARREPVEQRGRRPALHERPHDLRVDGGAARRHGAQRRDELDVVEHAVLEQVPDAARAVREELVHVQLLDVLRQQQHGQPGEPAPRLERGAQTLVRERRRQAHVEQGQVGECSSIAGRISSPWATPATTSTPCVASRRVRPSRRRNWSSASTMRTGSLRDRSGSPPA
ncbi:hypothetical protein GCM10025864_19640 [Luteimicrobium album]|uniref:SSD domain-containing protein n=1 Tax=Luteimicrobium album TaxID=1054550 RepID=A0ABQ6I0E0_9MICO|nr:hypothetical protein GCM10025864_19640 [Luteimicrobium album]